MVVLANNAFNLDWLVEVRFELSSEIIEDASVSEDVFVSLLVDSTELSSGALHPIKIKPNTIRTMINWRFRIKKILI